MVDSLAQRSEPGDLFVAELVRVQLSSRKLNSDEFSYNQIGNDRHSAT